VGKKTGPNPTDRAKEGTKRSLLTDGRGVPLGLAVEGANRNDFKMTQPTIESIPVERPMPTRNRPQGMCLDKGYDYDEARFIVGGYGFTPHIRSRGEEARCIRDEGLEPRRWVVERTHSWMNRFRRILVRWEKRADTFMAMLHLACGIVAWRAAGLLK
jgi:putative transposase